MTPVPRTAARGPLSYAIFRLARAHRAYAAGLLREVGLHPGQELLVTHLLDRDGWTQSELLEEVGLDHSTLSKSLRRMEDAGLVTRRPAEHDRRVLLVSLTERGRALREPLERVWERLDQVSTRGLEAARTRDFIGMATTIAESVTDRGRAEGERS